MPQGNLKVPGAATKTNQINKYFLKTLKGGKMFQLITIYKSYMLWLHFLEYPNISERCIKIVIMSDILLEKNPVWD